MTTEVSAFAIVADPIDANALESLVTHASAGALVRFDGVVRDHNEGLAVTRLEYEAYESMAVAEMTRIGAEITTAIPDLRIAAHHRVGSLAIGEAAIVCVASAPHRAQAFDACRMLIDRIKERVPIWKREHGPDGPYWVGWKDARCGHAHDHGNGG